MAAVSRREVLLTAHLVDMAFCQVKQVTWRLTGKLMLSHIQKDGKVLARNIWFLCFGTSNSIERFPIAVLKATAICGTSTSRFNIYTTALNMAQLSAPWTGIPAQNILSLAVDTSGTRPIYNVRRRWEFSCLFGALYLVWARPHNLNVKFIYF